MVKKSKEELSLDEMLTFVGLPVLPDPNDENRTWVRAIVQVERSTGVKDYVVATRDVFGWNGIRVKKESAGNGISRGIIGIYPFEYLYEKFYPKVSSKADIVNYIAINSNEDSSHLNSMSKDSLKKLFMQACINCQLTTPIQPEQRKFYKDVVGVFTEKKEDKKEEKVIIPETKKDVKKDGEEGKKENGGCVDGGVEEDF